MKKIIEAIKDFWKYTINYKYQDLMYKYVRVPKYKLQLMFKYFKEDYVCWDICNSSIEILFAQYIHFFETQEENLKPWLEDGKWQEHKHSENWEGTPVGEGSGLKYKDMLEIYMYIKYIRQENEKNHADLMHTLLSEKNYKTWWKDTDEIYKGEKCVQHCSERLSNFKIEYNYSENKVTDEHIYSLVGISTPAVIKHFNINLDKYLFVDNLTINITQLETTSDEYKEDFNALYKIEEELIELDNKYAKKIIDIRMYLWY